MYYACIRLNQSVVEAQLVVFGFRLSADILWLKRKADHKSKGLIPFLKLRNKTPSFVKFRQFDFNCFFNVTNTTYTIKQNGVLLLNSK